MVVDRPDTIYKIWGQTEAKATTSEEQTLQ